MDLRSCSHSTPWLATYPVEGILKRNDALYMIGVMLQPYNSSKAVTGPKFRPVYAGKSVTQQQSQSKHMSRFTCKVSGKQMQGGRDESMWTIDTNG